MLRRPSKAVTIGQALVVRLCAISDKAKSFNLRSHTIKPAAVWITGLPGRRSFLG